MREGHRGRSPSTRRWCPARGRVPRRCPDPALGGAVGPTSALVFLAGHALTWVGVADAGAHGSILWLAPGLVVSGFGMGVCLTAQIGAVMSQAKPEDAALVSGTLPTVQQLGNCIGVALVGLVYFAASNGAGVAFQHSLAYLAGVMAVLALAAAMPARQARPDRTRTR